MVQITRELATPLKPAGERDTRSWFQPTEEEWKYLHATISDDDEKVRERVFQVQKETYEHYPYPCIKMFHFTNLFMSMNTIYSKVIEAGRKGDTWFLDLGCFVGTDLRKLVLDGYPAANVSGCDLRKTFFDIGFKLYEDEKTCSITFLTGDIFDLDVAPSQPPPGMALSDARDLSDLKGTLSHIYAGALFHLYDEDTQYALALRLISLLKEGPGAIVFGRHQGKEEAGIIDENMGRVRYGHNATTWEKMWKKAFAESKGEAYAASNVVVEGEFRTIALGCGITHRWFFWSVTVV